MPFEETSMVSVPCSCSTALCGFMLRTDSKQPGSRGGREGRGVRGADVCFQAVHSAARGRGGKAPSTEDWHWGWVGWGKGVQTDTACSSKTISATHSLLPNSVNSAFLRRSMCVDFFFFFVLLLFTGVSVWGGWGEGCGEIGLLFNWGGREMRSGDNVPDHFQIFFRT